MSLVTQYFVITSQRDKVDIVLVTGKRQYSTPKLVQDRMFKLCIKVSGHVCVDAIKKLRLQLHSNNFNLHQLFNTV